MIYFDRQIAGARVAVWHVTEDYEDLLGLLPDAEAVQTEAEAQFRSEGRIMEWTAVRVLLCAMLGRQVHIEYTDDGAPRLPDYEGLHISISHTRGYVAVALSETKCVGIDVEQIEHSATPRVERVRSRFVRDDEMADSLVGLLLHWSAKEAAYKAIGRQSVDFKEELRIQPFDETQYEGQMQLEDLKEDETYTILYKVFDEFVLTFTQKEIES